MSDIMYPVSFDKLMNHILQEYALHQRIYNVTKIHHYEGTKVLKLFGKTLENPLEPAAGPHTQLAQNIIAAYVGGARFIELKTVQTMYGEELGIPRPCIYSNDESYNVEWSAEYRADEAMAEYIKAWFALKLISKEFGLGSPDGFIFNMSVGYNLAGIKDPLIDAFIENLKDAGKTETWQACKAWTLANLDRFKQIDAAYVENINSDICQSITLSTMHGCPANEIEAICSYLLEEKGLNLYLKCNPTLLGYDRVRTLLDDAGFAYVKFDKHQFEVDPTMADAVPMIERLQALGQKCGKQFGVKLTNTFPVQILEKELPGEQMYMAGKALLPLTITLAAELSRALDGKLAISYSGGADRKSIGDIFETGIWPITVCTTLLQGAGYDQLDDLAKRVESKDYDSITALNVPAIEKLAQTVALSPEFHKTEAMRIKRAKQPGFQAAHSEDYRCRVTCGTCVRVCPNRSNELVTVDGQKLIIHIDEACNECGNCACNCIEPCQPYKDRLTFFLDKARLQASENDGFYKAGEEWGFRFKGQEAVLPLEKLPSPLQSIVSAFSKELPYYL